MLQASYLHMLKRFNSMQGTHSQHVYIACQMMPSVDLLESEKSRQMIVTIQLKIAEKIVRSESRAKMLACVPVGVRFSGHQPLRVATIK